MTPVKKVPQYFKFLIAHRKTCTVHIYSADERVCSCGRDALLQFLAGMLDDSMKAGNYTTAKELKEFLKELK